MAMSITLAHYGVAKRDGQFAKPPVDVTKQVRKLVGPTGLAIEKVSNDGLKAGRVFPGERKRLVVRYTRKGVAQTVTALERKSLRIKG